MLYWQCHSILGVIHIIVIPSVFYGNASYPVNMILVMYVILCISSYDFNKLTMLYIDVHISLISMTNKSGSTFFLSIKYLSVCLFVLVSSFWFIWIPMLCVYYHYKSLSVRGSTSEIDVYRRHILTSKVYLRTVGVKWLRVYSVCFF